MRSSREKTEVLRLAATGLKDAEVATLTGVPSTTVGRWRRAGVLPVRRRGPQPLPPPPLQLVGEPYAYLLGLYLGDGCLSHGARVALLRVTLDARYHGIVDECVAAIAAVKPYGRVHVYTPRAERTAIVQSVGNAWLDAFPQHGPGRTHERPIELTDWQREIVDEFPREFLRGLIHSDGCRTTNRFKTKLPSGRVAEYEYARYFFSNLSADIRGLFCEYCERLGICWAQSNPRNISISHRDSVAILDEFVGPKS